MADRTLSVIEVANYLCVNPRTVRAWIHDGKLRAGKVGRCYAIPEQEVRALTSSSKPDSDPKLGKKKLIKAIRGCLAGTGASMEEFLELRRRDTKQLAKKPERNR
ncbi:MAG: helix-turn-helix domain-containing protein [Armatimonadetes bacterium]|nr:helix-turn-helix domain-containing protein [Armatimonadota bacterium]